jgi:hypothetical protein
LAARRAVELAQHQLAAAERMMETGRQVNERLLKKLKVRQAKAVAEHKRQNPEPGMPEGVRPESAYMDAPSIARRQAKSWKMAGDELLERRPEFRPSGLVTRDPVLKEIE